MSITAFLIEDDPLIRENLAIMLTELLDAHVVGTAETPDDALTWLAVYKRDWDVTVLDLGLKEGTGFTVLSQMSPAHRRRCVVLTNSPTPATIARCIGLGVDAVFDKSLQLEAFLSYCARLPAARGKGLGHDGVA